jgi:hypothetical protein
MIVRMTSAASSGASLRSPSQFAIQLVGGPTAILEYGGLRWLTDPALSPPGEYPGLTEAVYVSGDNASRAVVRTIAEKTGQVGIAVLNAGAVQLPKFDGGSSEVNASSSERRVPAA